MTRRARLLVAALLLLEGTKGPAAADERLVVLTTAGEMRDGLTVVRRHADPAPVLRVLTRGYSGRLLRLYALEQEYLRRATGRPPQPAYLVLSDRDGGFPETGFVLDGVPMPDAGWVDLHRRARLTGIFGAVDQIFPHELWHVILRQLAGEPRESGGNQVHAVGVRSDAVVAFDEGLAEHAQILAVDDDAALPETRALASDQRLRQRVGRDIDAYSRDLMRSPWWPVQASRLRFLLWFSRAEQLQRYHAVKANLFARQPALPAAPGAADPYAAYLFDSVVPASAGDPPRAPGVVLSIDGGVAHLFWRLITSAPLQQRYREEAFYAAFGATRDAIAPFDNVHLKLFSLLHAERPTTAADTVRAWGRRYPEDAADVERVARDALLGQDLPRGPELWLANPAVRTGTTMFDQYRALPRVHTFDVNAAREFDWRTVPGVSPETAARLLAGVPYASLEALLASPAVTPDLRSLIGRMAGGMTELLAERRTESARTLKISTLLAPYLWRLGVLVFGATLIAAWLARVTGVRRRSTAGAIGFTATVLVVAFAWVITSPPWLPLAAPLLVGGLPWALYRLARRQGARAAGAALAAWGLASVPALSMTLPT